MPIPSYRATEEELEDIRREAAARWGIPYAQAQQNIKALSGFEGGPAELRYFEPVTS